MSIVLPATGGLADAGPVGGFVAGAGKAFAVDEGFHEHWPDSVGFLPIGGYPFAERPEDLACEVFGGYPGQDQVACVVDDPG